MKNMTLRRILFPLLVLIASLAVFAGVRAPYAGLDLFSVAFPDQAKATVFWEDFDDEYALTSSEPVAASSPWIGTALSSGTTSFATDAAHGVMVLSGAVTTDNSGSQVQGDMEAYGLTTSKDTIFYARVKLSNATDSHFFAGLSITDTTICDGADGIAGLTPSDCIGFYKIDDAATIYIVSRRDSTVVGQSSVATLANDTYVILELRAKMRGTDGSGRIEAYVNGVYAGEFSATTLPYDGEEILTPSIALVSGTASGTVTATVDAAGVGLER